MSQLIFRSLKDKRIQDIFRNVLKNYPPLKLHTIVLEQVRMKKTTMRAQPSIKSYLTSKNFKKFKVQINSKAQLADSEKMERIPDEVIFGWFAHELGHVMDYRNRSFLGMIGFGLNYLASSNFRKEVEHKADEFAIEYGMAREILITKKYILEHSDLPEKYKRRIRKYYMSEEDVHTMLAHKEMDELLPEDVNIFDI